MKPLKLSSKLIFSYSTVIVLLFLIRAIFFAGEFGGVEMDSGWFLGVARNVATKGVYASYTNNIIETKVGGNPTIYGRFSVQDEQGLSYFPAAITAGPGYVLPQALMIKLFGSGFWQYRLWPLLAYTLLVGLSFWIVWRLGGLAALIFFQVWLWCAPQLSFPMAYEAYSEDIGTLYLLGSFVLSALALHYRKSSKAFWLIFGSGFLLGTAVETKTILVLPALAYTFLISWDCFAHRKEFRSLLTYWGLWLFGLLLPIGLYEGYRYVYLLNVFGLDGLEAANKDAEIIFRSNGSGLSLFQTLSNLDWNFVNQKITLWLDLGVRSAHALWLLILLGPILILRLLKKEDWHLHWLLYGAFALSAAWFVFLSPNGWSRHIWQGLWIGMILSSVTLGLLIHQLLKKREWAITLLLGIFVFSLIRTDRLHASFIFEPADLAKWQGYRYERGVQGLPTNPFFPLQDQIKMVNYFDNYISPQSTIYYLSWYPLPELSALTDRIFYPHERWLRYGSSNETAYLVLGPYQMGPLSHNSPEYKNQAVQEWCESSLYSNESYLVCPLKKR